MLELAEQMEASSHQLEARVLGRDQGVRGLLRVTMAPTIATHLLMPDFAEFARLHPEVEVERPVARRAGEPHQSRGGCRDTGRLRSQDPAAQPPRAEGTGAVRRRLPVPRPARGLAGGRGRARPLDRQGQRRPARLGARGRDPGRGGAVQDHERRRPDRRGAPGHGHGDASLLRRRRRPAAGQGAGHGPAPARHALAAHAGRDAQDQARAALHRVRVRTSAGLRAAARGTAARLD